MKRSTNRTHRTYRQVKDVKSVWVQYKSERTEALRNVLMEHYLHLVRFNAERVHSKLPDEVEVDDLMSAGIFGLMDAIDSFDLEPSREHWLVTNRERAKALPVIRDKGIPLPTAAAKRGSLGL